jgi:hypothetical protein
MTRSPAPDAARLDLLRASAQSRLPLALESLADLARRSGVPLATAREEARHLVSAGHWARTGRDADTRYAVTPAGREYLSARRRETHLSGSVRQSHRQARS